MRGGSGVAVGLAYFLVPESNVHWFTLVLQDERVSKQLRIVRTLLYILCEASVRCVVWCGVVWCGVVWCGVVCGMRCVV